MYQQIKAMAEEALKLQNKNFMDETFKKIIQTCECQIQLADSELLASAPSGFGKKSILDIGSGLLEGFKAHGYIPEEPSLDVQAEPTAGGQELTDEAGLAAHKAFMGDLHNSGLATVASHVTSGTNKARGKKGASK